MTKRFAFRRGSPLAEAPATPLLRADTALAQPAGMRPRQAAAAARRIRKAAGLQTLAALLFIPQAALLAGAVDTFADGGALAPVAGAAAATLGLGLIRAGCEAFGTRIAFDAARAELSALRAGAIAALAARSPLDSGRVASGRAASLLAEQAEALIPYRARLSPARLKAMLVPIAILLAVLPVSWLAALLLALALPLIPLFMALIGWRAKAASQAQMLELGGMNGFLLDRLRGLATIRALDAVEPTARRLRLQADGLARRTLAVLRIAFLSSAVLELFSALGVALVAVFVGFHLLGQIGFGTWGGRLDLGQGLFVLLLAPACFEPWRALAAVWHDRASGEAAIEALHGLAEPGLPLPGALGRPGAGLTGLVGAPELRIEGLGFRHAGAAAPCLTGFSLHLAPGEKLALMGPSGAGKSTLLALLAGLAPPDTGRIVIGGVPLKAETAPALRRRIAAIGQRPHWFAGTLTANVTLRRESIGRAAVAAALRFAGLGALAEARPGRRIGEGGAGLSGGEALRLALARALADPAADLILADEPTAHLDAATAADITGRLLVLARGRTLLVATHDPVLAARMDRIVTLEAAA